MIAATPTHTIGITGSTGFVGWHLLERLGRDSSLALVELPDSDFADPEKITTFVSQCDTVFHLAGMNRGDPAEIERVNVWLADCLVDACKASNARPHVIFASSTQIDLDNPYGRSKQEAGARLRRWAEEQVAPLSIMVIPNVFGDSGRPFYNSVVATFCHQLTHGQQPTISSDSEINLINVIELASVLADRATSKPNVVDEVRVAASTRQRVSRLAELLESFRADYYDKRVLPTCSDRFELDLYNAFVTYMEPSDWNQKLELRSDQRGHLFEIVKQRCGGQVFFSSTHPGITRGNHYHTRKMEKFCVVQGQAVIRLRRVGTTTVHEYQVSGDSPSIVQMPIFYTHNITNTGLGELLTLFWTNELFDPADPDTFAQPV